MQRDDVDVGPMLADLMRVVELIAPPLVMLDQIVMLDQNPHLERY